MNPEKRIADLERQLLDVRKSAVSMIVGMSEAVAQSPEGRDELARTFEEAAQTEAGETGHLARLVAAALRAK